MTDYSKTVQDLINLWSENKERTMIMTNWENKLVGEKAEPRYVILDFETTGANVTNHNDKELGYFKGQTWYDAIQIALIDTSVADENTQSGYKEYSWRIKPHKDYADRAEYISREVIAKKKDYDQAIRMIDRAKQKIRDMRKVGLESEESEFSPENIAFKILRRDGVLGNLTDLKQQAYDAKMSLSEE